MLCWLCRCGTHGYGGLTIHKYTGLVFCVGCVGGSYGRYTFCNLYFHSIYFGNLFKQLYRSTSHFKNNNSLKYINLPNVSTIGYSFLENNNTIKKLNLPNVKIIGENFLKFNNSLEEIQCPKLEYVGSSFLT